VDRQRGDSIYFKCIEKGCGGRAIYRVSAKIVETTKSHSTNHADHGRELARREFKNGVKEEVARDPLKPVPQIFQELRRHFNSAGVRGATEEDIQAALPIYDIVRSSAYRKRAKTLPLVPQNRGDLILDGVRRETNDDRPFVLDVDSDENKIVVFGTETFLRKLCAADIVFMDGIFKSAPQIFTQIYTLHIFWMGIMVPVVYSLLPDKSAQTYRRMFEIIQRAATRLNLQFKPRAFQIDFEIAMEVAILNVFGPETDVKGCLFHFGQSVWRKTQKPAIQKAYTENDEVKRLVRRLCGLALVPLALNDDCWLQIHAAALQMDEIDRLLSYFTQTNFDEVGCLFDRSMWSHFKTDGSRTINHLEGWHYTLNRAHHRPTIYYLLKELKNQHNFELDLHSTSREN
jgi:hypothetical protein